MKKFHMIFAKNETGESIEYLDLVTIPSPCTEVFARAG